VRSKARANATTAVGDTVNFLIDAQLPKQMVNWLATHHCHGRHTSDLPNGNRSTDLAILEVAAREQRVLITKDADFVDSHLLRQQPENCC
jgi:predicted nuclease of predicted toxin-antitoxin system